MGEFHGYGRLAKSKHIEDYGEEHNNLPIVNLNNPNIHWNIDKPD
jgi:hypothetical protein